MTPADTIRELGQVFGSGRTRSLVWRGTQLANLKNLLTDNTVALEQALYEDLGKSGYESWITEIGQVLTEISWLQRNLGSWAKPRKVRTPVAFWPARSQVQHEPRGTVLIISPWNYPVMLGLSPLAGAIAAGNAVVLKPSEIGRAVTRLITQLVGQYLDPHAVRVVNGGPEVVHEMIQAGPDHVFFTGSTQAGRSIAAACGQHLVSTTLELGGQSPSYVHDDADIRVTARRLVWGKFLNAGQTCVAPNHVYVHQAVAAPLIAAVRAEIETQYGPNVEQNAVYPRIISEKHAARIIDALQRTGGTVVHGGTTNVAQRYIAPTVVADVTENDALMESKLFGPVLHILTVTGADEAVQRIGQRDSPLACYLFTSSAQLKATFRTQVVAGGLGINIPVLQVANPHLPFGGVGASGYGQYHGRWSLETFTHQQAILDKPTRPDTIKLIANPVPKLVQAVVRKLVGYTA